MRPRNGCIVGAVVVAVLVFLVLPVVNIIPTTERVTKKNAAAFSNKDTSCTCPPGRYMSAANRTIRNEQLGRYCQKLLALGYTSRSRNNDGDETPDGEQTRRDWIVYEDSAWPKPGRCYNHHPPPAREPHVCQEGRFSFVSVVDHLVVYLTWKAGRSSVYRYLLRQFPSGQKMGACNAKTLQMPLPVAVANPKEFRQVLLVRDPATRVISGLQEIIRRQKSAAYFQRIGYDANNVSQSRSAMFRAFLQDLECVPTYEWWQHVASASYFATKSFLVDNHTLALTASFVNVVVHAETVEEGMQSIGVTALTIQSVPRQNVLPRHEQAARDEFSNTMASDVVLQQAVCRVYMQDYICFGYSLPAACLSLL